MAGPDADAPEPKAQEADSSASLSLSTVTSGDATRHRRLLKLVTATASFEVPTATGEQDGFLVTSPPSGTPADRPDRHPDPDDLIGAVGAGMQTLHQLSTAPFLADAEQGAFAGGWDVIAGRCRAAVANGKVDPAQLPEPYRRYSADQLLEMFINGKPTDPEDGADNVLCHGEPAMAQFLVNNGTFCGFATLANAVVADRHYDLAVIHQSVQLILGPEAVFRLYESYGQDPNVAKLEHYVLASHLLGTAPTQAVT